MVGGEEREMFLALMRVLEGRSCDFTGTCTAARCVGVGARPPLLHEAAAAHSSSSALMARGKSGLRVCVRVCVFVCVYLCVLRCSGRRMKDKLHFCK